MLKNYMETVVDHLLPSLIENNNKVCKCNKCQEDIKALALNNLKPQYVVSETGLLFSKMNEFKIQFQADVTNEITKAIDIVARNKRHE